MMFDAHSCRSLRLVAVTVVLMASITGCGFLFSHAPPANHAEMDFFSCTESNAGPIIDVIWGSLNVLGALAAAGDPDAYENSDQIIAIGLSWGALSGAAAAVGFNKSKQCREARQALASRQRQNLPAAVGADRLVQTVVVNPVTDTVSVGEQLQLRAMAHNSGGGAIPDKVFRWSSSNDAVASVSNSGMVTARAPGSVVIAANTDNVVGTASIVVRSR